MNQHTIRRIKHNYLKTSKNEVYRQVLFLLNKKNLSLRQIRLFMNQQQRELVERIGVINEKLGLQPVAARVNALLLVSEKNRLTFDEIQEELQVSKSSVSNAINLLLSTGQIDYITLPGERKRYFRTNIEKWPRLIERLMDFAVMYRNLFREIMEMRHDKDPDFIRSVEGLIDFINRLLEEVPRMLNEYNQNRN